MIRDGDLRTIFLLSTKLDGLPALTVPLLVKPRVDPSVGFLAQTAENMQLGLVAKAIPEALASGKLLIF